MVTSECRESGRLPGNHWHAVALLILAGCAAGVAAWALFGATFRDDEGYATGLIVLPLSVSVAALILSAGIILRCVRPALWLSLSLGSHAAALQLVDAGPRVGYQHYALGDLLAGMRVLPSAIVLFQAAATAAGLAALLRSGKVPALRFSSRIALAIGITVILGAAFSRRPETYASELALAGVIQVIALGNIMLVAISLPDAAIARAGALFSAVLGSHINEGGGANLRSSRTFPLALAIWSFSVALLLSFVSYDWHPHIPDEVSYLLQARYFSDGRLYLPALPAMQAFDLDLMHVADGKWYSPFPPGWPAVLAVGALIGVPWIVNPLLSGIAIVLAYRFLSATVPRPTARLSVFLLACSPWFLFMGMSLMSHTLALVLALCGAIAVNRIRRGGQTFWALAAGGATGFLSLARPLDGLVMAIVLGVSILIVTRGGRRLAAAVTFGMGCLAIGALVLPYNAALTGDPGVFPLTAYFDSHYEPGANDMGFGSDRGLGWTGLDPLHGHGMADVVINAGLNAFAVNVELLGWATGSVILVVACILWSPMKGVDRVMLAVIGTAIAAYSAYWFSGGPDFGARYWFLIIVPCLGLAARAVERLAQARGAALGNPDPITIRALTGIAALCLISLVTFVPWRAIDKYHHYRGMRPGVEALAKRYDFNNALVLVHGDRHPDYASAAVYNEHGEVDKGPTYAWARTTAIADSARAAFPARAVWDVNGPTRTGRGFEIVTPPE